MKNIMKYYRLASLLLIGALILTALISCGSQSGGGDEHPEETQTVKTDENEGKTVISCSSAEGKPGEEIKIELSIRNNPGIAGYSVTVLYDPDDLEATDVENKLQGGFATNNNTVAGALRVMATKAGGNTITENGVTDVITFKIKENASPKQSVLTVKINDDRDKVYRVNEDFTEYPDIEVIFENGTVTIEK